MWSEQQIKDFKRSVLEETVKKWNKSGWTVTSATTEDNKVIKS